MELNGQKKLRGIYETTIDSTLTCECNLKNIDYYSLICKAASNDKLYKYYGNNVCMFKYKHKENDCVLMIFSIPVNLSKDNGVVKHLADRIMEIITTVEKSFIFLEYVHSIEVKEDKFVYLTCIKKIEDKD